MHNSEERRKKKLYKDIKSVCKIESRMMMTLSIIKIHQAYSFSIRKKKLQNCREQYPTHYKEIIVYVKQNIANIRCMKWNIRSLEQIYNANFRSYIFQDILCKLCSCTFLARCSTRIHIFNELIKMYKFLYQRTY